jgi:hypothetical protein
VSAQRYWYLATDQLRPPLTGHSAEEERARSDWVRGLPEAVRQRVIESRVLTEPDWPEIHGYHAPGEETHSDEEGRVPMLFTTKEGAVSELRGIKKASEPPPYVRTVEAGWEEAGGEVVNSMPPYKVFGLDADQLVSKLKDAEFEYVMVDGRVQHRRDLIEELELELS